jgi:Ca-activated chloride channel homolog
MHTSLRPLLRPSLRRGLAASALAGLVLLSGCSDSEKSSFNTISNTLPDDSNEWATGTQPPLDRPAETAAAEAAAPETAAAAEIPTDTFAAAASDDDSSRSYPAPNSEATAPSQDWERAPEQPAPPPTTQPDPNINARDAGVNAEIDTRDDNQSTFAMDVDTGSYTLARAVVQQGQLPPIDAVRAEEFVNYFDQEYRSPVAGETFAIHVDGTATPFLASNKRIVRVGIQGRRIDAADRKPVNLTFVIDKSGSMAENNKFEQVKAGLRAALSQLRSDDQIAIVAFDDEAGVILNPTSATDRDTIERAIKSISPDGGTNAEAGLQRGYQYAQAMFREDATNRVVLLSDGVANVGPNGPEAILASIGDWSRRDIDLNTVGVGTATYNDEMMERLADQGNGFYAYIDSNAAAEKLFVEKFVGTVETIARNAKVQVEFDERTVASYRLLGFENRAIADRDFRNNAVDAGEIGAGHSVTALYEVTLTEKGVEARTGDSSFAKVRLRWEEPNGKVREMDNTLRANAIASDFAASDDHLRLDVVVVAYAEILRGGSWSRITDLQTVAVNAERLANGPFANSPEVRELAELTAAASRIKGRTW